MFKKLIYEEQEISLILYFLVYLKHGTEIVEIYNFDNCKEKAILS